MNALLPHLHQLAEQHAAVPAQLLTRARHYVSKGLSEKTKRRYLTAWALVLVVCDALGISPLPLPVWALAIVLSLMADAGYRVSSIALVHTAVSRIHIYQRLSDPTTDVFIRGLMRGIRRERQEYPQQSAALLIEDLFAIDRLLRANGNEVQGVRDHALFTNGFFGAFRRGEICAMQRRNYVARDGGFEVLIPKSKTDPFGKGRRIFIGPTHDAICPVASMQRWLRVRGNHDGPLFTRVWSNGRLGTSELRDHELGRLVKKYCAAIGHDPSTFSAHSLRAGFATEALRVLPTIHVMLQLRHEDPRTTKGYDRPRHYENLSAALVRQYA